MNLFGINKIMGHCRSSDQKRLEAGQLEVKESQSECVKGKSEGDAAPESSQQLPLKRPAPKKPCPNGESPPGENLYILKNCDHCADFTVGPCKKCRCARRPECSGQCHTTPKPTSQESMSPEEPVSIDTPPSTTVPEPSRHLGGSCGPQVCQVCRQQEVTEKHTCLCSNCNAKIQEAVNEVYVQCQGQCQKEGPAQAPPPSAYQPGQQGGQWQFNQGYNQGDRNANPYNIIVVQDCDNHAFMEQLTSAISRGAPQAGGPQMGGPQRWNPPNNGFQNVGGVVDYQYLDLNGERGGYDNPRDGGYDYGYDMGQAPADEQYLPEFEDRYTRRDSRSTGKRGCNRNTCPRRTESNQFPEGERKEDATTCTCNCPMCRKGFETKEKLAMLIAQALEIFIMGYQAKQNPVTEKKDKKGKKDKKDKKDKKGKDNKDNKNNKQRKGKGMNENRPKALPRSRSGGKAESGPSSPASSKQNFPQDNSQYPNFALPSKDPNPYSRDPGDSLENTSNQGSKNSNQRSIFQGSTKNFQKADRISQGSKNSQRSQNAPPATDDFFLPNCQEHRCKYNCGGLCSRPPHNCSKACKGHCRGACSVSKSGAGDGRSRSKNRGPQLPTHRHSRCEQCNKIEGRQWHEVDSCPGNAHSGTKSGAGCAGCGSSPDRNEGGGSRRGRNTLMGLSPIAHYRPGMLQFPVNYLLAGTQFRRRLSRTAAGVTLHQRPYVDEADVKDLPIFPLKRQESTLDTQVPPKKWL